MSADTVGPAFPCADLGDGFSEAAGMRLLRDYFAAHAMAAFIAADAIGARSYEEYAESAFAQADVMLRRRAE